MKASWLSRGSLCNTVTIHLYTSSIEACVLILKISSLFLIQFRVNIDWRIVAGDESGEAETQNEREMRVLEAIYPRTSAIPQKCDSYLSLDLSFYYTIYIYIYTRYTHTISLLHLHSPSALVEEDSIYNDMYTPVVPITPIEDEDAASALDSSFSSTSANTTIPRGTSSSGLSGVEPEIVAAAQSALTSVMSNGDQGTLIDRDLLIKILSDPKMIQQLVTNASSSSVQNSPSSSFSFHSTPAVSSALQHSSPAIPALSSPAIPALGSNIIASSGMPPLSGMHNNLPSTSTQYIPSFTSSPFDPAFSRPEFVPPSRAPSAGPFYPPGRVGSIPSNLRPSVPDVISAPPPPSVGPPVAKDINYYKSLIQQHGGERREVIPQQFAHQSNPPPPMTNQEASNMMMKPRDTKAKIMKPCIYFNSSRGCRNGANCSYQHDMSSSQQRVSSIPEVQSTKRVKLDREITGT